MCGHTAQTYDVSHATMLSIVSAKRALKSVDAVPKDSCRVPMDAEEC